MNKKRKIPLAKLRNVHNIVLAVAGGMTILVSIVLGVQAVVPRRTPPPPIAVPSPSSVAMRPSLNPRVLMAQMDPSQSPEPTPDDSVPTPTPLPFHSVTLNDLAMSLDPYGGDVDEVVAGSETPSTVYFYGSATHNSTCTSLENPATYLLEVYPAADGSCSSSARCRTDAMLEVAQCPAGTDTALYQLRLGLGSGEADVNPATWVARLVVQDQDTVGVSASASRTFTIVPPAPTPAPTDSAEVPVASETDATASEPAPAEPESIEPWVEAEPVTAPPE